MAKLSHDGIERLERLRRLLLEEEEEVRARSHSLREGKSPTELEQAGVLLRGARVVDRRAALLGRLRLILGEDNNRPGHLGRFEAGPGSSVAILERDEEGRLTPAGHGLVARRSRGHFEVVFDGVVDVGGVEVIDLLRGDDEVTLRRMKEGISTALSSEGRTARLIEILLGLVPPRPPRQSELQVDLALNEDQRIAVQRALLAEDVALVHGPPGTGKTHVLTEIVCQYVERGARVLALTASNAAIDHLALSLLGRVPDMRLARVGDPARVASDLEAHTLASLTEAHPHRTLARGLVEQAFEVLRTARRRSDRGREAWQREREAKAEAGRLFAEARRLERTAATDVLDKTRVLCGTLTGRFDELVSDSFDVLVVDEASQALTPAVLLGALAAERVVLAGDHKQLPPVVLSDKALRGGLGRTVFAELCDADEKRGFEVSRMLTVQHRMHEDLMRFPSRRSYAGRLVAHPAVAGRTLFDIIPAGERQVSLPERVLDVVDTAGTGFEELPGEGQSKENDGEAALVARLVRDLIDAGLLPGDVGVITPYAAQAARLQATLLDLVDRGLEVSSVDAFQGREKEAVVFSAVRSNVAGEVGFLADARRLNVAITRARRKLIVVGDSATLSADPEWRALFEDAIARTAYRSAFEIPEPA